MGDKSKHNSKGYNIARCFYEKNKHTHTDKIKGHILDLF